MSEYVCNSRQQTCVSLESYCENNIGVIDFYRCKYVRARNTHQVSINFPSISNTRAISSNSYNYSYYTDKIVDNSVNPPESYVINGVVRKIKSGNKSLLFFNGCGYRPKIITNSDGKKIETTYKVYSKMQGELYKNGNIKIYLDEENGETTNAKEDGKDIVYDSSYSSQSSFLLIKK